MNDYVVPKEVIERLIKTAEEKYLDKTAFHKGYQSAVMDFLYSINDFFEENH